MDKKRARVRRARKTRVRIAEQRATRLTVNRSNSHIYAQIIAPTGDKVLASASTLEADVRKDVKNGGNRGAATLVGRRIAERAKALGIESVAFDRAGFRFHGRVKALADAAREGGLKFGSGNSFHGTATSKSAPAAAAGRPRRRTAREDDLDQPRHEGREGRPHPGLRSAHGRRR